MTINEVKKIILTMPPYVTNISFAIDGAEYDCLDYDGSSDHDEKYFRSNDMLILSINGKKVTVFRKK